MKHSQTADRKTIFVAFFVSLIFHSLLAWLFPVTQDEAYYFYWSRFPDLGYFDHPPMIAWLAALGPKLGMGDSVFSYRFGGLLAATAFFPISIRFFQKFGLRLKHSLLTACILLHFNLAGLVFGFINTPDLPLTLFWLIALNEALSALQGQKLRWLSAGLATGLGIQSKYTMVLIGLVFLYGLWRSKGGLRKIWPYLGGVACILVLIPHLWWNSQHDWISFRFQLGRGFLSQYDVATQLAAQLPTPRPAAINSNEYQLAQYFRLAKKEEKPRRKPSQLERSLSRVGSYVGGQIALWGLLAPVMAWQYFHWRRQKTNRPTKTKLTSDQHLVLGAAVIPLLVFAVISPFQHIEANWPAVYLIGASAWLATRAWIRWQALAIGSLANMAVTFLLLWHSHMPFASPRPNKDRILKETHGYEQLASHLAKIQGPIFADTYQTVSMLAFYQPEFAIAQWPGVSRISELVRRPEMVPYQWQDIKEAASFHLLTEQLVPPLIADFEARRLWQIVDCVNGKLIVQEAMLSGNASPDCEAFVHRWTLTQYQRRG